MHIRNSSWIRSYVVNVNTQERNETDKTWLLDANLLLSCYVILCKFKKKLKIQFLYFLNFLKIAMIP